MGLFLCNITWKNKWTTTFTIYEARKWMDGLTKLLTAHTNIYTCVEKTACIYYNLCTVFIIVSTSFILAPIEIVATIFCFHFHSTIQSCVHVHVQYIKTHAYSHIHMRASPSVRTSIRHISFFVSFTKIVRCVRLYVSVFSFSSFFSSCEQGHVLNKRADFKVICLN